MNRSLIILLLLVGAWLSATPAAAAATSGTEAPARVALIGVPGLLWADIDPDHTPHLWRLAGESALGSLSVKAVGRVTCPYDGWLTVSAGRRSAVGARCGLPPAPEPRGEGAVVPGFDALVAGHDAGHAGTLGEAVRAAGHCTAAVGPGAALALADRTGAVDRYADTLAGLGDWSRCPVLAVDVPDLVRPYLTDGKLPEVAEKLSPADRRTALRAADAAVGATLAALPTGTTIVLAGLGDHGSVPHLRVAMWRTTGVAGDFVGGFVGANSTRRADTVILPDIAATVLTSAGIEVPADVIGVPWRATGAAALGAAVADLVRADRAGQTIRDTVGVFFTVFAVLQVAFYAAAFLLVGRRRGLRGVGVAGVVLASVPAATLLANLLPWDRADRPVLALVGAGLAGVALVAGLALAGPWRRHGLGPPAVVAGITCAVLLGDLLTGTPLQLNSWMGYTSVVGSRYYGLGNIPFALLATAVFLVTAVAADFLVRAGRRRAAVTLVVALGGVAMALAGWPGVGSDFGGVIAFVPGIAVTAMLVAGQRVSLPRLVLFCAGGGVLVMAIAFLDHLRPAASQTHLGRFFGQVLDGTFLPVIMRKLSAMLGTLLSPNLMPIVLTALAFLIFALLRPGAASAGALPAAFERAPMLRAALVGILVSGVVGMLVNDSGAAVLSMALALAVPLVLYAGSHELDRDRSAAPAPVPQTAHHGG